MAWIEVIPEEKASGKLAGLYARTKSMNGRVPNITAATSLKPDITEALGNLRTAIRTPDARLSVRRQEMMAVVTSALNNCTY